MLKFESLYLDNFKSYSGQELVFPGSGLTYLAGRNEVNPELGSNGAGKSTIGDALCWVLYGKTTRGLQGKDLLPWGGTEPDVRAIAVVNGCLVERVWTSRRIPNTLFIDNETATQEDVVRSILKGLTYDAFLHTVVQPQFRDSFPRMMPSARAALLAQAIHLDVWLDRSKRCARRKPAVQRELADVEACVLATESEIRVLKDQDYDSQAASWTGKQLEKIKKLRRKRRRIVEEATVDESPYLEVTNARLEELAKTLRRANKKLPELENAVIKARDEVSRTYNRLTRWHSKQEDAASAVFHATNLKGECPTCGTVLTPEQAERHHKHAAAWLKECSERVKGYRKARNTAREKEASAKEELSVCFRIITRTKEQIAECEAGLKELNANQRRFQSEVDQIDAAIRDLKDEENPFLERAQKVALQVAQSERHLRHFNRRANDLRTEVQMLDLWATGFKEVRGLIIEEVLDVYETEMRNVLAALGMAEWEVRVSAGKGKKDVTSSVYLTVTAPGAGEKEVPLEVYSGGESTRLELAAEMALSNLIQQQSGSQASLEIWDEPSQYINKVESVVEVLEERARTRGCALLYIDHRDSAAYAYENRITVVKRASGSVIE